MLRYTVTQRQYRICISERRCIFAQSAITLNKTKSGVDLLDKYLLFTTPIPLAKLLANLLFIGHVPKKRGRPKKRIRPTTVTSNSKFEDEA